MVALHVLDWTNGMSEEGLLLLAQQPMPSGLVTSSAGINNSFAKMDKNWQTVSLNKLNFG